MLDRLARDDVETLLAPVAPSDQRRLLGAMRTIEGVLWIAELDGERVGCVCVVADSEEAGFRRVREESHEEIGDGRVEEVWDLDLVGAGGGGVASGRAGT